MKFVCDRCQTRYSIADEKVRQKILRIRCKTCGNVIVVQGERSAGPGDAATDGGALAEHFEAAKTAVSSGPKSVPSSAPKAVPSSGPKSAPSSALRTVPSRPSSAPKAAPAVGPRPAAPGPPPLPPPAAGPGPNPLGGRVEWYLAIGGVRSGPFSRAEAAQRTIAAKPGKTVHVWKEGMPGWKPADEVSVIARELNVLRPPPPPPPPDAPMAPHALPKVAAMPPSVAKSAKAAQAPSAPLFPGKPLTPSPASISDALEIAVEMDSEAFADSTTKKKDIPYQSKQPDKGSFSDITTKKGKNLRDLEADPLFESVPTFAEADSPPLPAQPQPPVAAKVTPPAASSSVEMEAATVHGQQSRPAPHAADMETLGGFPNLPATVRGQQSRPAPHAASLPVAVPAGLSHPPRLASPAASSPALPALQTAPAASASQPDLGGISEAIREVAASAPPSSPEQVFPSLIPPSASETLPEQLSPNSGFLAGKRSGVKYLVAAGAIVVLVILIVLVTLRMDSRKVPDVAPTPSSTMEPEAMPEPKPAAVEPPKPAPLAEEQPAPAPRGKGKHGFGRTSRRMDVGPAPERQPAPTPAAKPTMAVRPNPFDETKAVSQSQISAVVRNKVNQDGLKSCYERALKMDNHLTSGRIDVTVSIGTSGIVQRVVINAPSSFILVEPCIKNAVKRWVFPPSSEEYGTNFPLIMQGGM